MCERVCEGEGLGGSTGGGGGGGEKEKKKREKKKHVHIQQRIYSHVRSKQTLASHSFRLVSCCRVYQSSVIPCLSWHIHTVSKEKPQSFHANVVDGVVIFFYRF